MFHEVIEQNSKEFSYIILEILFTFYREVGYRLLLGY